MESYEDINNDLSINLYPEFNLSENSKTFKDLNELINGNENFTLYLNEDYTFDSTSDSDFKEGVGINRTVTINGNGHILNGNNEARIFKSDTYIVLENIIFINGYSDNGGAIRGVNHISNCTFVNNHASSYGGAIYDADYVFNCYFANNSASEGGAVNLNNGIVSDCYFANNSASLGGAICIDAHAIGIYEVYVSNCSFVNNSAFSPWGWGGAIYATDCKISVSNCSFINNNALNYGGAIRCCYGTFSVSNCSFLNNSASSQGYGGAAYFEFKSNLAMSNCSFLNNSAYYGGAIYNSDAVNCTFNNNKAEKNGGAIYNGDAVNCTFNNNKAGVNGNNVYEVTIKVSYSPTTIVYNKNKKLILILKDSEGNYIYDTVSFSINGVVKTVLLPESQFELSIKDFVPNTYTVTVSYAGNDFYKAFSTNVKFTVKKATPKLTAKAKTFKKSVKTKKYSVNLKNNINKAIKNTKVTIKVNKKTYTAKTNSKGVATFKITKLNKKGTFKSTIIYNGDKCYNKIKKTVNIKVK